VEIPDDKALVTDTLVQELMGKDPSARFRLIMAGANEIDSLDV
jgi:hypothetical protein